jgi:hypothetical protein
VVVLLGASLAASLTTFRSGNLALADWPRGADFQLAYRLLGHLWVVQTSGEKLSMEQLIEKEPRASAVQVNHLLRDMLEARIASVDDNGDWRLIRDLGEMSLATLYLSGNYPLPILGENRLFQETGWDREFVAAMKDLQARGTDSLNRPLRPMYAGSVK